MASIFDGAPRTTATVLQIAATSDDLTDTASNTVFVEFTDADGNPSRGTQDFALTRRCSLEPGDEVEIAYVPFPEYFDRVTQPFIKVATGILKLMLKPFRKDHLVDEALEESENYVYYTIRIIDFDQYIW